MNLGAFSLSLAVKDLAASRAFYEKVGFAAFGGDPEQKCLILKNGTTVIGLFEGTFDKNLLAFNPGWDADAKEVPAFTDVRELQRRLEEQKVAIVTGADPATTGPAQFAVEDPDGNTILVDPHV